MIELVQFPWSPFCILQRRILEYAGARFKVVNIPSTDRSLVWKWTRERYYGVPILRDGRNVVFELGEETQVIAKYLDSRFQLGLFPAELEGVQSILWRHIENEVEGVCFRLNDIHWKEHTPKAEQVAFVRHKERKFGPGCLDQWREHEKQWLARLEECLLPFEEMVSHRPYLLQERPRFVDFDLYGMLGCLLYSGHYRLPRRYSGLADWYRRMDRLEART
ncbi:MAG: glutathione S-transferase family protein [Verrucomicrobiota bacterium]